MVTDGLRSEAIVSTSKVTTSPPDIDAFAGLYLLEGVPVTMCAVATVAWEGSPGVAVFGVSVRTRERDRQLEGLPPGL